MIIVIVILILKGGLEERVLAGEEEGRPEGCPRQEGHAAAEDQGLGIEKRARARA